MKEKEKKIGYVIHAIAKCPWQQQSDGGLNYLFQIVEPKGMESLSFRLATLFTVYEASQDEDEQACFFTRLTDAERALKRLRTAKMARGPEGYETEIVAVWLRETDKSIITKKLEEQTNG